jgi:dephospho-CoA kinase
MKKIGITGGIGSGKSYVSDIIKSMGFPVYHSDESAKSLMESNPVIKEDLQLLFGESIYEKGELNKKKLAELIFELPELREKVNALVHPIVRADFAQWASNQSKEIVFNEAAILFETGANTNFDATILVIAPEAIRIDRVMKRENCSRELVLKRIQSQWSDEQKSSLANFQIINDSVSPLLIQVEKVLEKISALNNLSSIIKTKSKLI